jgi:hypothetical protein
MSEGQSASLCWNKAPIWGVRPKFYYCYTGTGLMWSALSEERTDLSCTIADGARQRSHSRVRFPWDSRPNFTVSGSRLAFESPPTTRRATVEVFGPASTRGGLLLRNVIQGLGRFVWNKLMKGKWTSYVAHKNKRIYRAGH